MGYGFKKMKVAILVDLLIPGGVQKVATEEARNLNKLGLQTKLLVVSKEGFSKKNQYLTKGVPVEFLQNRYPKVLQKSFKLPVFRFLSTTHLLSPILAPFWVKQNEFDIILSHGTIAAFTAWSIKRYQKVPYIAIIHDPALYILDKIYSHTPLKILFPIIKALAYLLEKHFIKNANVCLVDSTVHKDFIQQNYNIGAQVLRLGINPPKNPIKKLGDKILTFGRWDKGKGLEILLELLKQLPDTNLIVAGAWSRQDELLWFKDLVREDGLSARVEIITEFNSKSLRKIVSQARFFIHPHFEAFSLSALEAASLGLPIIIPKKSGVTELFKHGIHGFFTKEATPAEFKKYTEILLKDSKLAFIMGRQAALAVKNHFTHLKRAEKLVLLIDEALPKRKKLVALETAHAGNQGFSGGDILLVEMLKRFRKPLDLTVIQHSSGSDHWEKPGLVLNLIKLKKNYFDTTVLPIMIFVSYLIRTFQAKSVLDKIQPPYILYSSSEILPDVIPAFLTKLIHPDSVWIARIHHIWLSPFKRPGSLMQNLGSYLLDKISLMTINMKADLVIVLNQNIKKYLKNHGFGEKKIEVLGGGVDYQAISKFKPLKVYFYCGVFLGRIHPVKGVFDLPVIWKEVVKTLPGAKLAVIGPGTKNSQNQLKKQVQGLGLEENIDILGFLSPKKVWSILKKAKIFLFTDYEAGFGLAVCEAMAAGLSVVGYNLQIFGDVYKKGYTTVPIGDKQAMAREITDLLKNPARRKKLSGEAILQAKKLDWELSAKKFGQIISFSHNVKE